MLISEIAVASITSDELIFISMFPPAADGFSLRAPLDLIP